MGTFYEDRRATADTLIRKYGQQVTLRIDESGQVVNSDTGMVTTPAVPVDHTAWALLYPENRGKRRGEAAEKAYSMRALVSAEGLGAVPTTDHALVVGGASYEIVNVQPLAPAGVAVIYELALAL